MEYLSWVQLCLAKAQITAPVSHCCLLTHGTLSLHLSDKWFEVKTAETDLWTHRILQYYLQIIFWPIKALAKMLYFSSIFSKKKRTKQELIVNTTSKFHWIKKINHRSIYKSIHCIMNASRHLLIVSCDLWIHCDLSAFLNSSCIC